VTRRRTITGLLALSTVVGVLLIPAPSEAARRIRRVRPVPTTLAPTSPIDILPTAPSDVLPTSATASAEAPTPVAAPTPVPTFVSGLLGLFTGGGADGGTSLLPTPTSTSPVETDPGVLAADPAALAAVPTPEAAVPTPGAAAALPPIFGGNFFFGSGFFDAIFQFIQQLLQSIFAGLCSFFGGTNCASF